MINKTLKWAAVAFTVAGAAFTAFNMFPQNVVAFNIGSILWLIFAIRIKENSLIVVNTLMLIIYIVGLAVNV